MKRLIFLAAILMAVPLMADVVHCPVHPVATCYDTGQVAPTNFKAHLFHCSCGEDIFVEATEPTTHQGIQGLNAPLPDYTVKPPDILGEQLKAQQLAAQRQQLVMQMGDYAQRNGCTWYKAHWYSEPQCLTWDQIAAQQKPPKKIKQRK